MIANGNKNKKGASVLVRDKIGTKVPTSMAKQHYKSKAGFADFKHHDIKKAKHCPKCQGN